MTQLDELLLCPLLIEVRRAAVVHDAELLLCAHLIEATTAAPEEIPHSKPSSLASRLAMSTLSLLLTLKTSSRIFASKTFGTKPAPMPCICISRAQLYSLHM